MRIDVPPKSKRKFTPRLKVWKLKDTQTSNHFQEVFNLHVSTSAGVADGTTEDIWNNMDCSKQVRRYVAQLGHTIGIVKPGGGTNMWKRPLLPSGQLSRPGRLVNTLGHHTMQPNEMPDIQCTMLVKKPTRRSTRILTPSFHRSTALLTSLEERTLMLLVTNLWRMMQERCQWAKTQSRRPGWSTTKGFSMLSLTGTQTTCHINHQWKARPSQSPLIWLRRLSRRWRQAKHRAHQA